jgi:hypothetical protein
MNCLTFLIAGCVTAASNSANGQANRFQFDDMIYTVPDGWKKGKQRDDRVSVYNSKDGFRQIWLMKSVDRPKTERRLETWLNNSIESTLDEKDLPKLKNAMADRKIKTPSGQVKMTFQTAGRKVRLGYAHLGKQKVNLVVFESRLPRDVDGASSLAKILKEVLLPFCLKLKYVSEGERPLLGKPKRGELEGLFFGNGYRYGADLNAKFTLNFFLFSKTGRFFFGLPKGGGIPSFDFDGAVRKQPDRSGNYQINDGQITFQYADGSTKTKPFERSGKSLKFGTVFTPATIPADGTCYQGLYQDLHYSEFTPGSGVTGSVTSHRSIKFSRSGKFDTRRFSGVAGNLSDSANNTIANFSSSKKQPKAQGSYEINDGELLLKYSDGTKSKRSIVEINKSLIFIDGRQYLKRSKQLPEK